MNIQEQIIAYQKEAENHNAHLVAVSKTKPNEAIKEAYTIGQRIFGENKAQELASKAEALPKDIEWHMIGHLQSNKVKYIAPFVHLIHAVDSLKLIKEINKQAFKNNRSINILLQIHIAQEEQKFGFDSDELSLLLENQAFKDFENIKILGFMGMATNTSDLNIVRNEFKTIKTYFEKAKKYNSKNIDLKELSIGMSGDYQIALEEGATLIRIGSAIFGSRNY